MLAVKTDVPTTSILEIEHIVRIILKETLIAIFISLIIHHISGCVGIPQIKVAQARVLGKNDKEFGF